MPGRFILLMPLALASAQTLLAGHGALHLDLMLQPVLFVLMMVLGLKIAASVISLSFGFRGGLFFASLFLRSLVVWRVRRSPLSLWNERPFGTSLAKSDSDAVECRSPINVTFNGGDMDRSRPTYMG